MDLKSKKILVTGGLGFLGTHVVNELLHRGVPIENINVSARKKYDLTQRSHCEEIVKGKDIVIHLAARVGGIGLNQRSPGELFYENLIMGTELMEAARKANIEKFVSIGTICCYPKFTPVPFKETSLWDGYPEETNAPYGLAKKMLLVQGQAYHQQYGLNAIFLLPVNLYGPGDNFDPSSSHVIPALIRKFMEAKENKEDGVEVWGTGKATREFLYVKDAARAIVLAAEKYDKPDPVNIGAGFEISICNLASKIANIVGFKGNIIWNASKPDGQPRRYLDTSKAFEEFGFKAKTKFDEGLKRTIDWYKKKHK